MQYYVYVLARPNGKVFYVGKGKGKRVFGHEAEARSGHTSHKCNVIRKIWKNGGQVQRYIIFTTDDEQEALEYERETIALYGLHNLTNQTTGGERAFVMGDDAKAKLVASLRQYRSTPEGRAAHLRQIESARRARKEKYASKHSPDGSCAVPFCTREATHGAHCRGHTYQRTQARKKGVEWQPKPLIEQRRQHGEVCEVAGCGRPYDTNGLCRTHYAHYSRAKKRGVEWIPHEIPEPPEGIRRRKA